jgi:hypothetical protein
MSIPMEQWGKDHFSLLAYVESRCVDHGGRPDFDHMRANPATHPHHIGPNVARGMRGGLLKWEPSYGTRLKGFWNPDKTEDPTKQLPDHDDWDCWEDMEAEGLIKDAGTGMNPIAKMTEKGLEIAALLRAHKAAGGNFAGFADKFSESLKKVTAQV